MRMGLKMRFDEYVSKHFVSSEFCIQLGANDQKSESQFPNEKRLNGKSDL